MNNFKKGDTFRFNGGNFAHNETIEIIQLLPPLKGDENVYLTVCKRDTKDDGSFDTVFYEIFTDLTLDGCYYIKSN